jgi:regulatory protein
VDLISRRPWTQAELTARLRRRGAEPSVAEAVVAELVDRGYLDDAAFARRWVEARAARGYGAARLRAELRARGVPTEVIAAALATLAPESALERCRQAARGRITTLRRAGPGRAAPRLVAYLLRRGFPSSVVARVVRETFREVPPSDD